MKQPGALLIQGRRRGRDIQGGALWWQQRDQLAEVFTKVYFTLNSKIIKNMFDVIVSFFLLNVVLYVITGGPLNCGLTTPNLSSVAASYESNVLLCGCLFSFFLCLSFSLSGIRNEKQKEYNKYGKQWCQYIFLWYVNSGTVRRKYSKVFVILD